MLVVHQFCHLILCPAVHQRCGLRIYVFVLWALCSQLHGRRSANLHLWEELAAESRPEVEIMACRKRDLSGVFLLEGRLGNTVGQARYDATHVRLAGTDYASGSTLAASWSQIPFRSRGSVEQLKPCGKEHLIGVGGRRSFTRAKAGPSVARESLREARLPVPQSSAFTSGGDY